MRNRVCYLLFCGGLLLLVLWSDAPLNPSAERPDAFLESAEAFSNIRLILPDGVKAGPYRADAGIGGGCLLLPYVNAGSESAPDMWKASGMIGFYQIDGAITWSGDVISAVSTFMNHSSFEEGEAVDHLAVPAFLIKGEHDLYTAPELFELQEADPSTVKTTAAYWYVFFARPEDEAGVVISLNADAFSREEMLRFAQSVRYEGR